MKKVFKAVFVLSVFTFMERVLGFLFKIFLSRHLGAEAIGVYQVAISFFFVLLTLTSSGIPLIVSKLTAKLRAEKNLQAEKSLSAAALILSTLISASVCLIILVFNKQIGRLFAEDESRKILLLMLPALLFSAVYSSLRGNLWGRQKYAAVSILELSEQVARIGVCVLLFAVGFNKLNAAALSLSIGCLLSAAVCVVWFFISGSGLGNPTTQLRPLIKNSLPITVSRASSSAINSLTAIIVPFLLVQHGLSKNQAMYEYGYSVGMALPLIYIPLTIIGSLAFVMIPTLSQAVAKKNSAGIKYQIEGALKIACVLGAMFVPQFFVFGESVGVFIYDNIDSGRFLTQAAWLLIPISVENMTASMMNSLDMELRGFFHSLCGAALMFSVFFISGKHFSVQLMSIGMGASWILSTSLNIIMMRKRAKISFKFLATLLISCLLCIPSISLCRWLMEICSGLNMLIAIILSGGITLMFNITLCFVFGTLKINYFVNKRKKIVAKA